MSVTSSPNDNALAQHRLLAGYQPPAGVFDELTGQGGVRPHYLDLISTMESLGADELRRRVDTVHRLVEEQGITYNVYGDPRGMERPWAIDPMPFMIAPEEWAELESGLIQRAILLNRILADCHGPQDLIRSKWLPPALVFAQPDFLRPCHGVPAPHGVFLNFYAVDLARTPDGRWRVLSDRTQVPTGAGYALANRLVVSRSLPEAFRTVCVHRMAGFFRELRASLRNMARRQTDEPRVVLLTPGPHNETYFEQAYLARYLGFTMVEGQDLTVRDDRVFLKTLSGLEPVDVIFRRVDDDFCDPLELRNDSILGVPGLVEALRAGNVAVANSLGSGLVQSPAFMAFLPGLCRHLLGQELLIPSVATWWCGQRNAEQYVLENLAELYVKPAFRSDSIEMAAGRDLSEVERDDLKARVRFQPELFAAQEWVDLSTAPAWEGSRLEPRAVALRVFLVASGGTYRVLPGGLTRVAAGRDRRFISMQRGGASKDTWVVSDKPVEDISLLHWAGKSIELRRVGDNLPSRLADCFFWMGRYSERADNTARLLRSSLLRLNPGRSGAPLSLLTPLLQVLESQGQLASGLATSSTATHSEQLESELHAVIFDEARPGSLRSIAIEIQRMGMQVRDRTSNDLWRALSKIDDDLTPSAPAQLGYARDTLGVLNHTILHLAALQGLARENMTRGQGWRFKDMGHRIERSIYISQLLERALALPNADNASLLEILLEAADSGITYRSRYNLLPDLGAVFDLVLLDDTNPRSLLFQILQLVKHFDRLPLERTGALPSPGQRILIESVSRLRLLDPRELTHMREGWSNSETAGVLQAILRDLPKLSDAIAASYFAHSTISRAGRGTVA